jgi:flagellar biogenesis protein FliO
VAETVSLGEKRFVAVVQVDGRHFLVAGGPTNIALLAQLDGKEAFEDVLKKTMTLPGKPTRKRKSAAFAAQPAKTSKQNPSPGAPPAVPLVAQNGTQTFRGVLRKTMSAPGAQPPKPNRKHNGEPAMGRTGQYA